MPVRLWYGQIAVAWWSCNKQTGVSWHSVPCAHKHACKHLHLQYIPSGLSGRPSQLKVLQLLLMLEVRVVQAWRGMVPITNGNESDKFKPPGMSTYTCKQEGNMQRRQVNECFSVLKAGLWWVYYCLRLSVHHKEVICLLFLYQLISQIVLGYYKKVSQLIR